MKILITTLLLLSSSLFAQTTTHSLNEHLRPFNDFIGNTYKGVFSSSTEENPMIDIQYWERILNGNGIRISHSVNQGEYGGESILQWDKEKEIIGCWYFTTAGFWTYSTIETNNDSFTFREKVSGNENGITETKGTTTLLKNGSLITETQFLQNGKWIFGHKIEYTQIHTEKPIFK